MLYKNGAQELGRFSYLTHYEHANTKYTWIQLLAHSSAYQITQMCIECDSRVNSRNVGEGSGTVVLCEEIFENYEESFFWGTACQFSNQAYSHTLLQAAEH